VTATDAELETTLKKNICVALDTMGFRVVRIQSGRAKVRGGWMWLAKKGTPDLLVLSPYVFLEVKRPGKELSPDQRDWHDWAKGAGVPVTTVRGVQEACRFVLGLRTEQEHRDRMGWEGRAANE